MISVKAYYGREPQILRTHDDVVSFLESVRVDSESLGYPIMTLWYVNGDEHTPEFGVGVNSDLGALSYSGRLYPGIWFSSGDVDVRGDDVLSYDYQGSEMPVPVRGEIPYADVLDAAVEFFRLDGDRPMSVRWQKLVR
ncbi:Imm1 family immunity protein [Actinokineospora iranica]|uniref:Immunity protein Imm1 n=1 Tax=Actinokineospora iranica TaxID=1271860 RepID=A0A1G6XE17_9PSEU|nr:Imm1 family immunity protein [Actinokineospora iranica]SDD76400.1 Immunity protein Imm1 [Actinokineospora iranica]